mmetsp:Transcript_42277/g.101738  ORF Transcript_42277/g.101738 Transcript_42277/m.101738 type:complete len:260 (-) Transcript_42277:402-1181(-)
MSRGIDCRTSSTSTVTGGTYSQGPWTIHLSPAIRFVASPSSKSSRAVSSSAWSFPRTYLSKISPFSSSSPGCRKNWVGPVTSLRSPIWAVPVGPTGLRITQNCRSVRTLRRSFWTSSSWTSQMWASVSSLVTSHSDPAFRTFPYTSVKVRAALRCKAVSPSITSARTCATTTSNTSGTKAPVLRHSHSSPARRVAPVRSLYSRVAWRRSAALGRTWMALIICCTTSSSARGTYVVSPATSHSSPATRPSKSRRARTLMA